MHDKGVLAGRVGTALGTLPCTGLNLTWVVLPGFALLMAAGAVFAHRPEEIGFVRTRSGQAAASLAIAGMAAVAWRGDSLLWREPFAALRAARTQGASGNHALAG